jgi:hypothetical protein
VLLSVLVGGELIGAERLSKFPVHGFPELTLDYRHYREIKIEALNEGHLDLLTNRPLSRISFDPHTVNCKLQSVSLDDAARQEPYPRFEPKCRLFSWIRPECHLYRYDLEDGSLFRFDPRFTYRVDNSKSNSIIRRASGIEFYGTVREILGYEFRFADNTERGNGPYLFRKDLLEDRFGYVGPLRGGDETYYDETEASLNWGSRLLNVSFGKQQVSWGPGRRTNLLISGNAPSFDLLRTRIRLTGSTQLTYLLGRLRPNTGLLGDTLYSTTDGWQRIEIEPKWMMAHRLEQMPTDWLLWSVSEAVIWGERGLDMAYLNPLNFLYSAQHDGGDRDNVALAGDVTVKLGKVGMAYLEVMIDDMKISKLGDGDPGNKFGILTGFWLPQVFEHELDLGLEYTRLEPYVYSHFFPINRFSTWNTPLGADIPPNSDRIELTIDYKPAPDLTLSFSGALHRHGSVGGSFTEGLPALGDSAAVDPHDGRFLSGIRSDWFAWGSEVSWEVIPGGVISAGVLNGAKYSLIPNRWFVSAGYRI